MILKLRAEFKNFKKNVFSRGKQLDGKRVEKMDKLERNDLNLAYI
jgi:hypothetical protein